MTYIAIVCGLVLLARTDSFLRRGSIRGRTLKLWSASYDFALGLPQNVDMKQFVFDWVDHFRSRHGNSSLAFIKSSINEMSSSLSLWRDSLQRGNLPEQMLAWPEENLFSAVNRTMNDICLPSLTKEHPEVLPDVLKSLLDIAGDYELMVQDAAFALDSRDNSNVPMMTRTRDGSKPDDQWMSAVRRDIANSVVGEFAAQWSGETVACMSEPSRVAHGRNSSGSSDGRDGEMDVLDGSWMTRDEFRAPRAGNSFQNLLDSQWGARGALLTVSALYGSNFGCVKILNHALEPSFAAACRFSLAGLVFLPYLLRQWRTSTALMLGGLEVGAYCAVGYWAQAKALLTSSASTVAFICSLAVIVVPLLDLLFSGKSHKSMQDAFVPAVLAALGVACLELGGQSLPGIGDLWAGLQPLFFGLGFWRVERHMARVQGPDDVLAFTGAMMLAVGILSWAWTGVDLVLPLLSAKTQLLGALSGQLGALKDFTVLAAIAWTGVVTTAFTSFVENVAMKKLTAAESTVIYSTEPLWGTAFAAAVLHESVGWNTLVGAALILTACVWSSLGPLLSTSLMTSTLSAYRDTLEEVIDNISKNLFGLLDASGNLPGEL